MKTTFTLLIDQVYSNTRVLTQVKASQHESTRVENKFRPQEIEEIWLNRIQT